MARTGDAYEAANPLDGLGHPYAALGKHDQAFAVWQEVLRLYRAQNRPHDAQRVQRQLAELPEAAGTRANRT